MSEARSVARAVQMSRSGMAHTIEIEGTKACLAQAQGRIAGERRRFRDAGDAARYLRGRVSPSRLRRLVSVADGHPPAGDPVHAAAQALVRGRLWVVVPTVASTDPATSERNGSLPDAADPLPVTNLADLAQAPEPAQSDLGLRSVAEADWSGLRMQSRVRVTWQPPAIDDDEDLEVAA